MSIGLLGIDLGDKMPHFSLESGDCHELSSSELLGKVIFIFYDNKNTFKRNSDFKHELFQEYLALTEAERASIEILQVIDCTEARLISSFFWKKALVRNSRKYNLQLWGDWDGGLKRNYHFLDEESYMLIIDQMGKVIYYQDALFLPARIQGITEIVKEILSSADMR